MVRPWPNFAEVSSLLQLEAMTQARKASRPPQVFHAAPRPPPPTPAAGPAPAAPQPPPGCRPNPNYREKNPTYRPPTPRLEAPPSPAAPAATPPAAPTWQPPNDPWTGLVQAWPMPWSAPSPYGAPPAYTWTWSPGFRPSIGSPGLLGSRPPEQVYKRPGFPARLHGSALAVNACVAIHVQRPCRSPVHACTIDSKIHPCAIDLNCSTKLGSSRLHRRHEQFHT